MGVLLEMSNNDGLCLERDYICFESSKKTLSSAIISQINHLCRTFKKKLCTDLLFFRFGQEREKKRFSKE